MGCVCGPVPSRRLGNSLGIDPLPHKVCTYDCVYCQLGRTRRCTTRRCSFVLPEVVISEFRSVLSRSATSSIDCVTFVGQGEPLLYAGIGQLIREVKRLSELRVAVITNGALLRDQDVRVELHEADVVMPSLDAADQETFLRVNRPCRGIDIAEVIEGLVSFGEQFAGQLWVEAMLVRGVNDSPLALRSLRNALARIAPDEVHINVPVRPPAESWVQVPEDESLVRAISVLGDVARVIVPAQGAFSLAPGLPLSEAISEIIRRHPMTLEDILTAIGEESVTVVEASLTRLVATGQAERITHGGNVFWRYREPASHRRSE